MVEKRKSLLHFVQGVRAAGKKVKQEVNQIAEAMGGGKRKAVEFKNSKETFTEQRNIETAKKEAEKLEKKYNDFRRANPRRGPEAEQELRHAYQAIGEAKQQLKERALELVRKRGYKRFGRAATLAALGIGAIQAYNSPSDEKQEELKSKYRWSPDRGWEENENGKWNPQQNEFGKDKDNNVNYYDGQNWIPDYIQGSDGTVYNSQGEIIGSAGDLDTMHNAGYNNIFDYNAAQALGRQVTPEQVAAIQQMLGVTADGKWGARTQAAFENASTNSPLKFDSKDRLYTIYW